MGNLHSLKRAILRNPSAWSNWYQGAGRNWRKPEGGEWKCYATESYKKFVKKVLGGIAPSDTRSKDAS